MEYMEIGSAPYEENCVGVTSDGDYHQAMKNECRRYKTLLEGAYPPPGDAHLGIKSNPHDFGTYYEVVAYYNPSHEDEVQWAFMLEGDIPGTWDELEGLQPIDNSPAHHVEMDDYDGEFSMDEMMETMMDGVVTSTCMECGEYIDTEPDATKAWCYSCQRSVRVKNPFIEMGII